MFMLSCSCVDRVAIYSYNKKLAVSSRRVRIGGWEVITNRPTSVGGPLLPLSNDQYAIFAPDVEAVTVEVLAWVPRSMQQYILHLKNLPFLYYAHLSMSSNRPVN